MDDIDRANEYRKLPSVDELLRDERTSSLVAAHPRKVVADGLRDALEKARETIGGGGDAPDFGALLNLAEESIKGRSVRSLRRAINATGVIIHTGLGRAPLAEEACAAVAEIARHHSTVEIDTETGKRGSRQSHVEGLLMEITGAEAAFVVNNNAAAVLLAVNTHAMGREVVISRGQLVEIGGSFRLPDVISRAGARLVEVGTTNRTRISDYEDAVRFDTGAVLRCHPSNYKISGFTEETSLMELAALARESFFPFVLIDDLGSGAFVDVSQWGLGYEPTVQESARAGADIVCFSGDKLLGASQAGIMVGKAEAIDACRSNPLARALRVDKLTLAALEATLRIYRDGDPASRIPVLAAISRPLPGINRQTRNLARRINFLKVPGLVASVVPVLSETGGGSLPGQSLESRAVALKSDSLSAEYMSEHFRGNEPPVFGRIAKDAFLLDVRMVDPRDIADILGCAARLAQ